MNDQAFYNEIDKDAAAWLRELIAEGHIAPGVVDERSIEDVRPDELAGFTQCHFFAGVGIWSLALRASGIPDDYRIWTGSCPCQPFSSAGKSYGFDDERHLWPAFHYLISQRRPAAVLGEQVASKNAMPWIDLVHTDLEAMGYAFGAIPFPTAGVGGPHIRDRLYWGAFSAGVTQGDTGSKGLQGLGGHGDHGHQPGWLDAITAGPVATAGELGKLGHAQSGRFGERGNAPLPGSGGHADSASDAVGRMAYPGRVAHRSEVEAANHGQPQANGPADQLGGCGDTPWELADTDSKAEGGRGIFGPEQSDGAGAGQSCERLAGLCTDGRLADLHCDGRNQAGQHIATTRSDGTFGDGSTGRPGPVNGFWRAADWLHCRDGKWRPVEPTHVEMVDGNSEVLGRMSSMLSGLGSVAEIHEGGLGNDELQKLSEGIGAQTICREAGGQNSIPEAGVLRPGLHVDLHGRSDQSGERKEFTPPVMQNSGEDLRTVQGTEQKTSCASPGREPLEQRPIQFDDVVRFLPSSLPFAEFSGDKWTAKGLRALRSAFGEDWALCNSSESIEAIWSSFSEEKKNRFRLGFDAARWKVVATHPLAEALPRSMGDLSPELQRLASLAGLSKASLKRAKQFRVGSLRGYGNAINAMAAQTFIESILEQS